MSRCASVSRWAMVLVVAATTIGAASGPAGAHQNPGTCGASAIRVVLFRDKVLVRNGDTITYIVKVSNDAPGTCDFTATTVSFTGPAPDGSATGLKTVFGTGFNFPAGTALTTIGTVTYTVAANPGVTDLVAREDVTGTVHDAPTDHTGGGFQTLGTQVTQPHTTLSSSVTPTSGQGPLAVTFTYAEKNDSSTPAPIATVTVTDDACSPVKFTGGDTNGNGVLDVGEIWTYACTRTITTAGVITSHVVAHGTNMADLLAAPDEQAGTVVTVTGKAVGPSAAPSASSSVLGQKQKRPAIPVTGTGLPLVPMLLLGLGLVAGGWSLLRRGTRRA